MERHLDSLEVWVSMQKSLVKQEQRRKTQMGWFIGITPKLATGVWVGWEDRATHFWSTGEGQGRNGASYLGVFHEENLC